MKQSSSTHLGGFPIDTKTLAGQWVTFSHMANHYRKLLNVKPRVDTGLAPSGSFHNHTMQSSKSANKMGCVPSKWRNSTNSNKTNNNSNSMYTSRDSMRLLYGSHPDHLNTCSANTMKECKSPSKAKTKKQTTQQYSPHHHQEYQVVFGPSSIRSSTDAFLSDETESLISNDKPPSEVAPIGVTEKIRRFLNHIHQLDLTTPSIAKPKRATTAPVTCPLKSERPAKVSGGKGHSTPTSGTVNLATNNSKIDFRLSRHSKCFLPCEPKSPSKKSIVITSPALTKKKISDKSGSSKKANKAVVGEPRSNSYAHHFHSPRMSRKLFNEEDFRMLPEKELCGSSKKPGKSRKRAGSMVSIGTICGSDELTPEDFPISIKDICSTLERGIVPDDDLILRMSDNHRKPKKVEEHISSRKPVGKASRHGSGIKISSSMTSLVPSSSKSNANGNGAAQATSNNKDSSRDSAYGFSSGESRITTRESTPEKKCRDFLSNANSHVDLQDKPCKDVHIEDFHKPSTTNKSSSVNPHKHHRSSKDHNKSHSHSKKDSPNGKKTRSTYDLKRDSSERYITFLAEVTQDIVSKGIYTNKGLKNLFKSHMDQNKELNHDKLSDMMERLRMDLGIPKDDALDKIEFGYGSINNTAKNTFFYTPQDDKVPMSPVASKMDAHVDGSLPSTSSSPPTIIPNGLIPATTNTTTTTGFSSSGPNTSSNQSTTDEGGDVISGPSSEHDDDNDKHRVNDVDDDDELNFSEEEVTQALKLAGLDAGATEEVMEILNI
ncbi:unnamed protein product [Orchesella dallaii]|uniref:Spermatogenesis-associated protein 7 n=1 Tax=Orchesella dallaii TaxID=48710 RepID=A0ABP1QAW0_9HEXA